MAWCCFSPACDGIVCAHRNYGIRLAFAVPVGLVVFLIGFIYYNVVFLYCGVLFDPGFTGPASFGGAPHTSHPSAGDRDPAPVGPSRSSGSPRAREQTCGNVSSPMVKSMNGLRESRSANIVFCNRKVKQMRANSWRLTGGGSQPAAQPAAGGSQATAHCDGSLHTGDASARQCAVTSATTEHMLRNVPFSLFGIALWQFPFCWSEG